MPLAFVAIRPIVVFIRCTGGQLKEVFVFADLSGKFSHTAAAAQWSQTNHNNSEKNKVPLIKLNHLFSPLPPKCLNKITFLACKIKPSLTMFNEQLQLNSPDFNCQLFVEAKLSGGGKKSDFLKKKNL